MNFHSKKKKLSVFLDTIIIRYSYFTDQRERLAEHNPEYD